MITMHFTSTSVSWMNMVFFGIITRHAIPVGSVTSVKDLINAIEVFIEGWNQRCEGITVLLQRRQPWCGRSRGGRAENDRTVISCDP